MKGKETGRDSVKVMITTPLERELVQKIERTSPHLEILYDPALLPPPRYPSDHQGDRTFRRTMEGKRRWEEMLYSAEVLFGIPDGESEGLTYVLRRSPHLRWIQATSAGAGEHVRMAELSSKDLERVAITTASGVHAVPLAEFCIFGLLAFTKGLPRIAHDKSNKLWDHYPMQEMRGRTALIVGLGKIGLEVARLAHCFGMHTIGLKRHPDVRVPHINEVHSPEHLKSLIPRVNAVIVTLPLTKETQGMIDQEAIGLMKSDCIFVNVGRGGVVDETALTEALSEERILGAALDVFEREPLPSESPLWNLPNVLISPHTAALAKSENKRIVKLFQENLQRYLCGEPLFNRVDTDIFY